MKTRIVKKVILSIIAITATIIMLGVGESKATLQSNQNTQYTMADVYYNWMTNFRKMETTGGVIGVNETLNEDLTPSSGSNNIDSHMMKSTEYGAIAILSASGYGNPSNDQAITTTTGNNTGMILNTNNWEMMAAEPIEEALFIGIDSRYYNIYEGADEVREKAGDALGTSTSTNPGCRGWHAAAYSRWPGRGSQILLRGSAGIFSFNEQGRGYNIYSRGVIICGTGL